MQLTASELELLKECVSANSPILVCELTSQKLFCCPTCCNVLDREYIRYCNCCGQALNWYGSIKHARMLGEEDKPERTITEPSLSEQSKTIEEEIKALKKQLKEKRQSLKELQQKEEIKASRSPRSR